LATFLFYATAPAPACDFLPEHLTNAGEWLKAWRAVTPADANAGSRVRDCAPRRAATACRGIRLTPVVNNKGIQSFAPGVGVPASDLDVRLVSPEGTRTALTGCGRRSGFMASRAVRRLRRPAAVKSTVGKKWPATGGRPR